MVRPWYAAAPLQALSPESILARIDAAHVTATSRRGPFSPGPPAIAFDGDGTLWSGDIGEDFFAATLAAARFLPASVAAMGEVGRAAGVELDLRDGRQTAERLFAAYLAHRVPEDTICEMIAWVCAGWTEDEVYALAQDVVTRGDLTSRMQPALAPILAWSRATGVEAFLVSASPRPVVEVAGALLGFDPAHILAATAPLVFPPQAGLVEGARRVMLAEVERPIPYGPGKATLLEARLAGRTLLAAFGDNVFDIPMLRAARVGVAVEPKPRLLAELLRLGERGEPLDLVRLQKP